MKSYILSIAGVILISALISILAPSGRMGKFVKGMTKLFILVVLISPFAKMAGGDPLSFRTGKIGQDENFLAAYTELLCRRDEEDIARFLKEKYDASGEIVVSRKSDDFSYEKISVAVTDFGINDGESHIDILSQIEEALLDRYDCGVEVS